MIKQHRTHSENTRPRKSIPGVKFCIESKFQIMKRQILHTEANIEESQPKMQITVLYGTNQDFWSDVGDVDFLCGVFQDSFGVLGVIFGGRLEAV